MFKNGRIYKLLPEEIKSIHYIYAKNGKEAIDKAYARIKKEWGSSPDFLFNCELFNIETREPQSSVVEKGKIHLLTDGHGISFVDNKKPVWSYMNNVKAPDYVGVYPTLVRNGIIQVNASPSGLEVRGAEPLSASTEELLIYRACRDRYNDATLHELAEAYLRRRDKRRKLRRRRQLPMDYSGR